MSGCGGCCSSGPHNHKKEEWDPECEKFFEVLLNGGIKIKEAIEVGTKAVEYFRGVDFFKYVSKNATKIHSTNAALVAMCGSGPTDTSEMLATKLGQQLIGKQFIVRTEHRPLAPISDEKIEAEKSEDTPQIPAHLRDNAKWPRRVGITRDNQNFDEKGFYAILYEKTTAFNHLLLIGIISAVLCACLFPIWPFPLKIAVWYAGVAFMSLMIFLIIIRLIAFVACWYAGCDFWFLPTLFDEDAGFIDSFYPLYSFVWRKDDMLMLGARVFAAILSVGCFYKLSETHTFSDMSSVGSRAFLDILDWGHQKLAEGPANADIALKTSTEQLSPEKALAINWEKCVKHCEFADFEEFKDFCMNDCDCMEELWASNCWKSCMPDIQAKLKVAKTTCIADASEGDDPSGLGGGNMDDGEEYDFDGEVEAPEKQEL